MIHLEHVALWTSDVDRLTAFYVRFFDACAGAPYANPDKGFASRFLTFGSGARLEIMSTTALPLVHAAAGAQRFGLTHLALCVGREADVDRLTECLRADGHRVVDEPRRTGDGYYESVVLDPDGNRLELTAGPAP